MSEIRKNRVVVDIRDLNKFLMSNLCSLLLQSDVIVDFHECTHIFVLDVASFFYQ